MVTLFGGLSATTLAGRLATYLGKPTSLSQRGLAKQIGIPRTTLQDFLRSPEGRRAATVAKISNALTSKAAQVVTQMDRTARVDAPLFTRESLRALTRPVDASGASPLGFRFVVQDDRYASGLSTTITNMSALENPEDALGMVGDDTDAIVSVVWVYR